MTTNPDPILERMRGAPFCPFDSVRRFQGHAWVDLLADIERWSDEHLATAHAEIDACPPDLLDPLVERRRAALWSLLVARDLVPRRKREPCHPPSRGESTKADHHHLPRGLARHLYPQRIPEHDHA